MALKISSGFSLIPPNSSLYPYKPFRPPLPPSSLRLRLRLPAFKRPTPFPFSITPHAIFLPHLEVLPSQEEEDEEEEEDEPVNLEGDDEEGGDQEEDEVGPEEETSDPIINFFKSRSSAQDPKNEGRVAFQRNRRTSWHIANIDDDVENESNFRDDEEEHNELDSGSSSSCPEEGVCGEILKLARSLPENATLEDVMGSYVGKIGEGECIELLKRMGEERMVWSCLYLFQWMGLQEPSLVTPRACSVLFPVLGQAGMGKKIMLLFENLLPARRFKDVCVYNAAISGLSCCGRYDDALKVYEALEANNVHPDHVTCSILITLMRKKGHSAKDAWEFFECMNRKGVKWSLEVFGALIKSFCDEGLKKEALIIQSEMEKKGISSNAIIYNTLIHAFNKSNKVEEAEGLFAEMKEKGIRPTAVTYNILMDAYSRRMQPEIVEDLLLEMQNSGLKPNVKSYTCLVSSYGRQRKMSDMAANSFLRMKKAGIKPTSHSYTALIHAYSVDGWHKKAYKAFESMRREGLAPSIETYTVLLDAFRRAGDTQMLMEIWKSMMNSKVEGTRVTFNILLDGLAKQGFYVQARDVIYEFGKLGFQPTVMTYNMLMNAYARGGQHYKLPQLLKEMATFNLKPDSITYSTMIYAYVRVRDFTTAFYYHKQMVKTGQVPDAKSYQKLRAILDVKAATKNRRDRSAILGIVNSKFGMKRKKGKKDELWKDRKRRSMINKLIGDNKLSS